MILIKLEIKDGRKFTELVTKSIFRTGNVNIFPEISH